MPAFTDGLLYRYYVEQSLSSRQAVELALGQWLKRAEQEGQRPSDAEIEAERQRLRQLAAWWKRSDYK